MSKYCTESTIFAPLHEKIAQYDLNAYFGGRESTLVHGAKLSFGGKSMFNSTVELVNYTEYVGCCIYNAYYTNPGSSPVASGSATDQGSITASLVYIGLLPSSTIVPLGQIYFQHKGGPVEITYKHINRDKELPESETLYTGTIVAIETYHGPFTYVNAAINLNKVTHTISTFSKERNDKTGNDTTGHNFHTGAPE